MLQHAPQSTALVDADPWLTLRDAATLAKVHRSTLLKFVINGRLRHARVGDRAIRIRRSWLDGFLESCARPTSKATG